jgi:uncharacterized protein (DUF1778 family)
MSQSATILKHPKVKESACILLSACSKHSAVKGGTMSNMTIQIRRQSQIAHDIQTAATMVNLGTQQFCTYAIAELAATIYSRANLQTPEAIRQLLHSLNLPPASMQKSATSSGTPATPETSR